MIDTVRELRRHVRAVIGERRRTPMNETGTETARQPLQTSSQAALSVLPEAAEPRLRNKNLTVTASVSYVR
jgi:hypothetical protein